MKLNVFFGAFVKPFVKIAGGVFGAVLVASLYYKLVKFLYTIPFPCREYRYLGPDCMTAELLAIITTMLTIALAVGFILNDR